MSIDIKVITFITGLPTTGESPAQYLDDKTKEKALTEEMKKTYGTERSSRGIIIKRIGDTVTRMATKLMACKMLRKCCKEEVHDGVVAVAAQCASGTLLSWAPYLLNLFLDDYKDAQDLGTKFHYSWLILLIALIEWKEPPYSHFCEWIGRCRAAQYTSLGRNSDAKHRSANAGTFARYLSEMQESIVNSWRIMPDVIVQFKDIANFKASRHNMWIQARRDPGKEWLQLTYCVTDEDIEMAMRDWHNDWKIPVLTQEVPKSTEVDAGQTKTPAGDKIAPKKPKPTQKSTQQKKGVRQRKMRRQERTLP